MSTAQPQVNLRQLRNQAKDLHHASNTHAAADALARIRLHHPRFAQATPQQVEAGFTLQEAQHVVAREQGYDSWPKLVAAVEDRRAADGDGRFTKDELRGIETLHEHLAEYVKDVYRRAGEADAEVRIQFVDQVTWAEYQGSRPVGGWAYSYVAGPLEGSAIFDLPLATAQRLDRLARGRVSPTFLTDLQAVVSGQRQREDLREGDHLRYIAQLMENGIEATWTPVMGMDMHDIHLEADPDHPWRRVAEPADVVAYVQLATSEGDVALRACYPYQTLIPELPTLAEIGRRGHA